MRIYDLGTVIEVGFEAIIVSGIMRCGDDYTCICPEFADGEGELGSGARAVEKVGIAPKVGAGLGTEFREVFREMASVMGEDEDRLPVWASKLFCIGDQPSDGTAEIVEIHRRRAHTWMLWPSIWPAVSLLGLRHDFANGPSPQTTRAERESLEKPII